ncbi:MAG: hypothetical protein ABIP51_06535 [Bacteroidia bacterium]
MYKVVRVFATLFLLVFFVGAIKAQSNPTYTTITQTLKGTGSVISPTTITFPVIGKTFAQASFLRERNKSAKLYFKLDLGNDYVKNATNWNFKVQVDLSYQFAALPLVSKTLIIDDKKPELLKIDNVLSTINSTNNITPLAVTITSVGIVDGLGNPITNALLLNYINANVRLSTTIEREYEVDVRLQNGLMSNAPVITPINVTGRLVTFSWQPVSVDAYSNYEVQILKLYNIDPALQTNLNQIASDVDWNKALKVETQSYKNSVKLTMAEGTGYYMWRVRAIGNYFNGGIANVENYGEWSYALPTSTATTILNKNVLVSPSNPTPYAFHFTDQDESINWIYSRVFTEGDNINKNNPTGVKSSEGISYANGLLMSRQSQKYNSSENTNIVSQTEIDYSGRPALTTIPVPVSGNLTGYKVALVTNTLGALYTAASFDADSKLNAPDKVKDNGVNNAYSYYSNNSTIPNGIDNTNVPNAEGYAFKRTLFKTDGTNRVAEESGVGKVHSLGSQTNGQGRTTIVLYGTPSEDELIRIFGDEAPLANSVIKTITIDQNNVSSVSYTSKEGKTIATALISDNATNLKPLQKVATTLTVTNSIRENVSTNGKIIASKRIAIPTNTTLVKLTYINDNLPGAGSGCPSGNCGFKMRFYLTDLKQGITYISDADGNVGITDFTPANNFSFPSGWRLVSLDPSSPGTITPVGANNNEISLNAGEYIFVKEIFSGNNNSSYIDNLINVENDKLKPVIDALLAQMQIINSPASYANFTALTNSLISLMSTYNTNAVYTPQASLPLFTLLQMDVNALPPGYFFPASSDFSLAPITTNTVDPSLNNFEIKTGCCGSLKTVIPGPPICYVCDGSPDPLYATTVTLSVMSAANSNTAIPITPYGINDFKNDPNWNSLSDANKLTAINSLVEREFIKPLKDRMTDENFNVATDLWKFLPGFSYQSLNYMFSNMLISQYYTGNAIKNTIDNKWYAASYNSATGGYSLSVPVNSLTNIPYNYDCKKLFEAWRGAIELINSFATGSDDNILNAFNQQGDYGSGQDNSEDDGNWLLNNALAKKYLKKKISKELEEFNDSDGGKMTAARKEAETSVIKQFMDEAGTQFAAIIDGSPLPDYISIGNGVYPNDYVSYPASPSGPGNIYTSITTGALVNNNVPLLFQVTGPITYTWTCSTQASTITSNELYYPFILKPEWCFKYFVYNVFENQQTVAPAINYIDDNSTIIPNQVSIDIQRKYNMPYSYVPATLTVNLNPTDLCSTPSPLTYSVGANTNTVNYIHYNWSAGERSSFYGSIKGSSKCYASKGIDPIPGDFYDPANQLPKCLNKQELFDLTLKDLNDRIADCFTKKEVIKASLISELTSSCYTIVACKTGNGAGQITEKEIDLMVTAVIAQATTQVQFVKTAFLAGISNTTAITACTNPSLAIQSYGNSLCDLPFCSETFCKEIVLFNNNTLGLKTSNKIDSKIYRNCDQKLLDMISSGTFLPYIAPLNGCNKPAKIWKTCNDGPACSNGHPYGEKTPCSQVEYRAYSNSYNVTATGN